MIAHCAVLLLAAVSLSLSEDDPVVETPLGKVRGFTMTSRAGNTFYAFKGIPYAKPPVGDLRFQPPKPLEPWSGVLDAKKDGPLCIQVSIFDPTRAVQGVEDCLYLSVFSRNLSGSAPVIFHMHGGAHTTGSPLPFGPHYFMDKDIVVVKSTYRLGIFGFLTFENTEMPGNQGLKDQLQALRWVQQNIASFGGDPNLVTLLGESSGAGCVYNHIISPMSRGLFHRGIAESGSSYALWNLAPPGFAKTRAEKLMTLIDCPTAFKEAMPCIMKKNATDIASKFKYFQEWQIDPVINFGPVLEPPGPNAFMVGPVSEWKHNPVPLMMGLTSAEGLLRTSIMVAYKTDFKWYSENFNKLAPVSLIYMASASKPDELTSKIRQFYFPNNEISMNDWVNLTNMYTDSWFGVAVIDGANKHKGDVFLYYFDYPLTGKYLFATPDPKLNFGTFHCGDMALMWNLSLPLVPNVETAEEIQLSEQFMTMISTFVRQGSPVPENGDIEWPKWTANDNNCMYITKEGFHLENGLLEDRYKFWKSLDYRDNYEKNFIKNLLLDNFSFEVPAALEASNH